MKYLTFGKIILLTIMMLQETTMYAQNKFAYAGNDFPELPDKIGFAGMYAGIIDGDVIAAGGANFLGKMPWDGGVKSWSDAIYIFKAEVGEWKKQTQKLPLKMAYGVSVSYGNGVILAGGCTEANKNINDVFLLKEKDGVVSIKQLASMPVRLANMCGDLVGDYLFIAGGSENAEGLSTQNFLAYDIKGDKWEALGNIPGPARINAVSASSEGKFYLFTGIQISPTSQGTKRKVLTDAYSFSPKFLAGKLIGGNWKKLAEIPRGMAAGPSPAPVVNGEYIVLFGGLDQETAQHADPKTHLGFLPDVFQYSLRNNTWESAGRLPKQEVRLTVPTVIYQRQCLLVNGEIGPGARTNKIYAVDLTNSK
jgi:N-acetylneuraminic acid mutarotase